VVACRVELLCRAGHFEEAERLVKKMPARPKIAIWDALLNDCDIHENVNQVDHVRSRIMGLEPEPQGSGVYVLSNIYGS
jgi:pentatricopeptide repeat protein